MKLGKDEYMLEENFLKYIIFIDIIVLLQKGDIISSQVDVFFSLVSLIFFYKEGLFKLILEKGGYIMKEECYSII